MAGSFRAEFKVQGEWGRNQVNLATKEEAESYAKDKMVFWTLPTEYRIVTDPDAPNFTYTQTKGLVSIPSGV